MLAERIKIMDKDMIIKTLASVIVSLAGLIGLTIYALVTYSSDIYNALEDDSLIKIQTQIENVHTNIESVVENTEKTIEGNIIEIHGHVESAMSKTDETIQGHAEQFKSNVNSAVESTNLQIQGSVKNINETDVEEDESIE